MLTLTQNNHLQMNNCLANAIAKFDEQMSLDNKALKLIKR